MFGVGLQIRITLMRIRALLFILNADLDPVFVNFNAGSVRILLLIKVMGICRAFEGSKLKKNA